MGDRVWGVRTHAGVVATRSIADDAPVACFGARWLPYTAIVDHIRANLSRRITVAELAGIARLSAFQLSRAFRREHATTPYRLVLEMRIEHAKDRLRAGATISETALQAGFADQSHLTRHFRRLTGMTPKRYTRRMGSAGTRKRVAACRKSAAASGAG